MTKAGFRLRRVHERFLVPCFVGVGKWGVSGSRPPTSAIRHVQSACTVASQVDRASARLHRFWLRAVRMLFTFEMIL